MVDFLGIPNFEYIGGAIALIVILYFLFRTFKFGGWSRITEEKEELREERDLQRTTKDVKKLQRNERRIIKKMIRKFEELIVNYKNFLSVSQAGTPNELKRRQTHLSPAEIIDAIQSLILQLKRIENENIALKTEESLFEDFVKNWSIVYNELRNLSLIPRPHMDDAFAKMFQIIGKTLGEINGFIKNLGLDLSLEEKLDERKKRELLILYQQTQKEEGVSSLATKPGRLF